jgi:hypothetical protein
MTGVHGTPTEDELEALAAISSRIGLEVPQWVQKEGRSKNE